MEFTPTATSQKAEPEAQPAFNQTPESIDALLSSDLSAAEPVEQRPEPVDEGTQSQDTETQESDVATADEATETEAVEEDADPALPAENEADFSDSVYDRYAKHFAKTHGVELNLQDPAHRALLRENILRGQAIERMKQQPAEKTDDSEVEATTADEAQAQPTRQPTEQEVFEATEKYAAERVNPAFALKIYSNHLKTLWPKEMADGQIQVRQEDANEYAKGRMIEGVSFMREIFPSLAQEFMGVLNQQYPMLSTVHDGAIRDQAIDNLESQKDTTGKAAFPDLARMIESGSVKKFFGENPEIRDAKYLDPKGKPLSPVKNTERKLQIALKVLRGESVSPTLLNQAVQTGKKQAQTIAKKVSASRLAPGQTRGGFEPEKTDDFVSSMVNISGSKFHAAIEGSKRK